MNMSTLLRTAVLACSLVALAGCGVSQQVNRDLAQARDDVLTKNITLDADDGSAPAAEITPHNDLLIDGRPVPLTASQRGLVRRYRQQTVRIALQGIDIGRQGADIGLHAAGPAVVMALFGASDDTIERHVQKQLAPVHAAVAKLCNSLPALMATGQQLATSLPAFRPYATLTPEKIRKCRADALDGENLTRVDSGRF